MANLRDEETKLFSRELLMRSLKDLAKRETLT